MKRALILTAVALAGSLAISGTAYAQEPTLGSITFNLEIKGLDDSRLSFDFDPGADFTLRDNGSVTRSDLSEGEYTLTLDMDSYRIADADCDGISASRVDRSSRTLTIDLDGEDVECDIEVEKVKREPTSTATPAPTSTPAPPTATATPRPAIVDCGGSVIFVRFGEVGQCPTPAPVATSTPVPAPVLVSQPTIRPPATGDGGLR